MNATNLRVFAAILFLMLLVWVFGSCGKGGSSAVHRSTATGAQQAGKGHTQSLQEVISQIDSYPVPKGVSAALWSSLTSKLKQLIIARSADGKTISTTATGSLNAVSDLSASSNGAGTQATVTWTEKLGGDCNNDAQVDIADLQPIAAHYGENSSGPGSAAYLADANGDGQVGITDLQPIAADYSMHIEGYCVYRGHWNGSAIVWESTPRPNSNVADPNWSEDRPAPPSAERPYYTYTDDLTTAPDTTNVRYKVEPYGDGAEGVDSNIATMPPPGTTFTVNGTVTYLGNGLGGVTMTLTPGGQSTVTASDGTYTIPGVANGSYTLTPSLATYTFTPTTRSITVAGADLVNEDFTASQGTTTYNVKGTVTFLGNGLSGVLLTLAPGGQNATTVADGTYTISGVANGSYTLTPTKTGYTFSPATRSVNVSGADVTGQDFTASTTAATHTVSGTVTAYAVGLAGVKMFLSPGFSATTQADGTYSIPNVPDGNYALLPVNSGYTYTPVSKLISMSGADLPGEDFTAVMTGLEAGSAWPKFGNDVRNTGFSPYVGPQTNTLKWTLTTQAAIQWSPVIAADGTIYVGGYDGVVQNSDVLYALNPADGSIKWECNTGSRIESCPAIGNDGTIYGGDTAYVFHAINPDGTIKWDCNLATNAIYTSPAISPNGTIYFADGSGEVFAVDPLTGMQIWLSILPDGVSTCPALGADGTLYVGTHGWSVYALDPADGSVKWSYLTDGYVDYPGSIGADGTIYFTSHGGTVYALTPAGGLKWSVQPSGGESVDSSPAIGPDGTIYVGSYTDEYALNPSNGSTKWDYTTFAGGVVGAGAAIGADGTVYIGADDNYIYALNGSSGVEKWRRITSAAGAVRGTPAIGSNGVVYFGCDDNKLYAIGP